jgi:hypothetical protein
MNSNVKELTGDERIKRHEKLISNLLQDRDSRGYYAMYSIIHPGIQIPNHSLHCLEVIYS